MAANQDRIEEQRDQQRVIQAFARLDSHALGLSCGIAGSIILFIMTAALTLKGPAHSMACIDPSTGLDRGDHLGLLTHFLPGYSVTWSGAFVGLGWGLVVGYLAGFFLASFLNTHHRIYLRVIERRFRREGLIDG